MDEAEGWVTDVLGSEELVPRPAQGRMNRKPRLSAADPDRVQANEV